MIETRNGNLACDPFVEVEGTSGTQTAGFKGRDDKKGLMVSTVVYSDGDSDYSPGSKVWILNKDRLWNEIQFKGRKVVLLPKSEILLVEPSAKGQQSPCGSPYHGSFINCPYCA